MKLTWLDDFFGILRIVFNGTMLPRRATLSFEGDAVASVDDDEDNDQTIVTILAGGAGRRGRVTIPGDVDHTLTVDELANAIIVKTGTLTADRQLVFGGPASDADAYTRVVRNDSDSLSAGSVIATTGSGATVSIPPGCSMTLGFDFTTGTFVINTGAPA